MLTQDEHLAARAKSALAGRRLSEDELARAVYGAAGSVVPWLPLLRRLLSRHEQFERGSDGLWGLRSREPAPALAMSGRATRAREGRLLALAISPLDASRPVWKWLFVQEGRTAGYVRRSAAFDEDSEQQAVLFADVAAELRELLDSRVVFLLDPRLYRVVEQEFEACSIAPPSVELRPCGSELWGDGAEKPRLSSVRKAAGLAPEHPDELLSELELIRALDGRSLRVEPMTPRSEITSDLRDSLRRRAAEFPERPGVYLFRDREGRVLYAGSAVGVNVHGN